MQLGGATRLLVASAARLRRPPAIRRLAEVADELAGGDPEVPNNPKVSKVDARVVRVGVPASARDDVRGVPRVSAVARSPAEGAARAPRRRAPRPRCSALVPARAAAGCAIAVCERLLQGEDARARRGPALLQQDERGDEREAGHHSYLSASMGSSRDALRAG